MYDELNKLPLPEESANTPAPQATAPLPDASYKRDQEFAKMPAITDSLGKRPEVDVDMAEEPLDMQVKLLRSTPLLVQSAPPTPPQEMQIMLVPKAPPTPEVAAPQPVAKETKNKRKSKTKVKTASVKKRRSIASVTVADTPALRKAVKKNKSAKKKNKKTGFADEGRRRLKLEKT